MGMKEDLDKPDAFEINPKKKYPLVKDTVLVPAAGFIVVRFIADNPGKPTR